jgi:hypothetical protein
MSKVTLEAERLQLKADIDFFQFPCPDCGRHVGKIAWDKKKGGECPHCFAHIEPKDFQTLIDALAAKWARVIELAKLITEASTLEHAAELRKALPQWETFLLGGCKADDFTRSLYRMLSATFYNIAHTNRDGFFMVQFGELALSVATLNRMVAFVKKKERSDKESPMAKLEDDIVSLLEETEVLPKMAKDLERETRTSELAELKRLREKYPNQ